MANGYKPFAGAAYYVDGYRNSNLSFLYGGSSTAPGSRYLPGDYYNKGGNNCVDSSQTTTYFDSYAYIYAYLYGDSYPTTSLRGRVVLSSNSLRYLAKNASALAVLTLGGNDAGFSLPGSRCQKIYVNVPLIATVPARTNSLGHTGNLLPTGGTGLQYFNSWAGRTVYWQGAWADSKTTQLSFTTAVKIVLPTKPNTSVPDGCRAHVYKTSLGGTQGPQGPFNSSLYNPIERFTRK